MYVCICGIWILLYQCVLPIVCMRVFSENINSVNLWYNLWTLKMAMCFLEIINKIRSYTRSSLYMCASMYPLSLLTKCLYNRKCSKTSSLLHKQAINYDLWLSNTNILSISQAIRERGTGEQMNRSYYLNV